MAALRMTTGKATLTQVLLLCSPALHARCPCRPRNRRRSARLSDGLVLNGSLCCSYHGWSFSGCGKCTRVPQAPSPEANQHICASSRSHLHIFPTKARLSDRAGKPPPACWDHRPGEHAKSHGVPSCYKC